VALTNQRTTEYSRRR